MILYVDASALLRDLLGQAGAIDDLEGYSNLVTSALAEVECLRTVDRLRIREGLDDRRSSILRESVFRLLEGVELVEVSRAVLLRASHPLPTALSTLDAIHLATAVLWREKAAEAMTFATHDRALATAARAIGFAILGA
jgi:predicted nucleic acid-binding protein